MPRRVNSKWLTKKETSFYTIDFSGLGADRQGLLAEKLPLLRRLRRSQRLADRRTVDQGQGGQAALVKRLGRIIVQVQIISSEITFLDIENYVFYI